MPYIGGVPRTGMADTILGGRQVVAHEAQAAAQRKMAEKQFVLDAIRTGLAGVNTVKDIALGGEGVIPMIQKMALAKSQQDQAAQEAYLSSQTQKDVARIRNEGQMGAAKYQADEARAYHLDPRQAGVLRGLGAVQGEAGAQDILTAKTVKAPPGGVQEMERALTTNTPISPEGSVAANYAAAIAELGRYPGLNQAIAGYSKDPNSFASKEAIARAYGVQAVRNEDPAYQAAMASALDKMIKESGGQFPAAPGAVDMQAGTEAMLKNRVNGPPVFSAQGISGSSIYRLPPENTGVVEGLLEHARQRMNPKTGPTSPLAITPKAMEYLNPYVRQAFQTTPLR